MFVMIKLRIWKLYSDCVKYREIGRDSLHVTILSPCAQSQEHTILISSITLHDSQVLRRICTIASLQFFYLCTTKHLLTHPSLCLNCSIVGI